jgi:nucleotide-binding universal stress UspA family protein
MSAQDQLELDRPAAAESERNLPDLAPKTILVHIQDDESVNTRLQSALALGRAYSAHITCLHVTPIQAYVAFDSFGGVFVMKDVIEALDEQEAKLRSKIEAELRNEDVSWDYSQVTGSVESQLVRHAALADLLVTGRTPHRSDFVGPAISLLADVMYRSRTPLFIPQDDGPPADPTGPALIAWDGSYEAANAVRSALGMLALSSNVHVLQIEEEKSETFPSTGLLEYLSRHGIHAELTVEPEAKLDRDLIPDLLVARAMTVEASYLVMGGYNHNRIGEYLFGGVTRAMLKDAPLPIVIAH